MAKLLLAAAVIRDPWDKRRPIRDFLDCVKKQGFSHLKIDEDLEKFILEGLTEYVIYQSSLLVPLETILSSSRPYKHLHRLSRNLSKLTASSGMASGQGSRARSRSVLLEQLSL